MMNVFTEKILGSPFTWAPSVISTIAMDLQASRQLWNARCAG